jgi:hypothetical protein
MTHSEPHIASPKPSEQPPSEQSPHHSPKHITDEAAQNTAE